MRIFPVIRIRSRDFRLPPVIIFLKKVLKKFPSGIYYGEDVPSL